MNWQRMLPTQLGSMGDCVASGNVSPLAVTRSKAPKAPTILKYFKLKIANSWLLYTQSKQITTSEENIKDFKRHLVVLKIDLHIWTKIAKWYFYIPFYWNNEDISLL